MPVYSSYIGLFTFLFLDPILPEFNANRIKGTHWCLRVWCEDPGRWTRWTIDARNVVQIRLARSGDSHHISFQVCVTG